MPELDAIQNEIDEITEANRVEWMILGSEAMPQEDRERRLNGILASHLRLAELVRRKWLLQAEAKRDHSGDVGGPE